MAEHHTNKRKLIDHLLRVKTQQDLITFAAVRRASGDSWSDICAKVYGEVGETISPTWLVLQCEAEIEALRRLEAATATERNAGLALTETQAEDKVGNCSDCGAHHLVDPAGVRTAVLAYECAACDAWLAAAVAEATP